MLDLFERDRSQQAESPTKRKHRFSRLFSRRRPEAPDSLFLEPAVEASLQDPALHGSGEMTGHGKGSQVTELALMMRAASMNTTPSLALSLRSSDSLGTLDRHALATPVPFTAATFHSSTSHGSYGPMMATTTTMLAGERDPESRAYSIPSGGSSNPSEQRFLFERALAQGPPPQQQYQQSILQQHQHQQQQQAAMVLGHAATAASVPRIMPASTFAALQPPPLSRRQQDVQMGVRRVRTWTSQQQHDPDSFGVSSSNRTQTIASESTAGLPRGARDTARYARMPLPNLPAGVQARMAAVSHLASRTGGLRMTAAEAARRTSGIRSAPATPTRKGVGGRQASAAAAAAGSHQAMPVIGLATGPAGMIASMELGSRFATVGKENDGGNRQRHSMSEVA